MLVIIMLFESRNLVFAASYEESNDTTMNVAIIAYALI
jgi:hypothetical protein